jgi:beta-galactosidase/beta-glucuronidase
LPANFQKDRVLLNFGAVDQVCKAFINGELVGKHEGGYLPFAVDITSALKSGENVLTVSVQDDADSEIYGRGKQKYKRGGIWYTATSGIWQSVWLESVPNGYLEGMRLTPCAAEKTLKKGIKTRIIKKKEKICRPLLALIAFGSKIGKIRSRLA